MPTDLLYDLPIDAERARSTPRGDREVHVPEDLKRQTTFVDHHIGMRIRERRRQIGMNQQKLADALGVAFPQIQKYERGTNRVSASRLYETAIALKVSILFFYEGLKDTPQAWEDADIERVARTLLQTAEGAELARAFPRVTSGRLRQKVVELVISVADPEEDYIAENERTKEPSSD